MNSYLLSHLADGTLLLQLAELVSRDHTTIAALLAHLGEVDERRLYAPAGYESMYAYCIGELHMSEDAVCTRIRAARLARRFPAAFPSLADGRLHLSGLIQLSTHLDEANAESLIAAAAHRTKSQIDQLLAERYPRRDVATSLLPIGSDVSLGDPSVPERMNGGLDLVTERAGSSPLSVPERMNSKTGASNSTSNSIRTRVQALAPQRYALQCNLDQTAHDDLRQIESLLGHRIPSGDLDRVVGYALRLARRELDKRKFGADARACANTSPATGRHVPAVVKNAVWTRDAGRCTFVSDSGHRCESRKFLEFDHIEPVTKGGKSTDANVRLRCRAHNQYEAERALGSEFMRRKRSEARSRRAGVRDAAVTEQARVESAEKARAAAEQVRAATEAQAAAERAQSEVIPLLRRLGFRAEEARQAAASGITDPNAPLEQRVRQALRQLAPQGVRVARFAASPG